MCLLVFFPFFPLQAIKTRRPYYAIFVTEAETSQVQMALVALFWMETAPVTRKFWWHHGDGGWRWWCEGLFKKKQRLVVVHVNSKGKFEVNHSCSQLKWIPDEWHEVDHPLKKNTHAYCREYSFQRKRVTTHNARNPGMWIMANVKNFRVPEGNKQKQEKIKTSGEVSSLYRQNN